MTIKQYIKPYSYIISGKEQLKTLKALMARDDLIAHSSNETK